MSNPRTLKLFYYLPLILWMCFIFGASTTAGGSGNSLLLLKKVIMWLEPSKTRHLTPDDWDPLNYVMRKLAHFTEYSIMTLLALRAFQFGAPRLKSKALLGALAVTVGYAMTDEIHQSFVPGRTAAVRDVLIDSVGAMFILSVVLLWNLHRKVEMRLREAKAA